MINPQRILKTAPPAAFGPPQRTIPIRKKPNFIPPVQRWSVQLPEPELVVGILGVQAPAATTPTTAATHLQDSPFMRWARTALAQHPHGPRVHDHARTTVDGRDHHVITAYWPSIRTYEAWRADPDVEGWWTSAERLRDGVGVWREIMRVPAERFESIYWLDYPGGLMRDEAMAVYPTPYCGYYGAMRDRFPVADNAFKRYGSAPTRSPNEEVVTGRWRVRPPHNTSIIRSAHTWQFMDAEQLADYTTRLKPPLAAGMAYLHDASDDAGCLSVRVHTTTDADGQLQPEGHTTAYFSSLGDMEAWSEGHRTHAAIFGAAVARYKHYGGDNQLRTWHEVMVLPDDREQLFEYINCHPETGLLPYFDPERVA